MASRLLINASSSKEDIFNDLVGQHERRLRQVMQSIESEVLALTNQFNVSGGLLTSEAVNVNIALNARQDLAGIFTREFTGGYITPTVKDFDKMVLGVRDYLKTVGIDVPFTKLDTTIISGLKQGAFVSLDVMGRDFQSTLANEMYTSVLSNRPFTDMVTSLQGSLRSIEDVRGVPMSVRAEQMAHDALLQMDRTLSAKKAEDAGITHYLYFGSTVKDTRDFCQQHVGEIKTKEEWDDIGQGDWQGKSSSDLFATAGGYNCGHQLIPVPPSEV